MTDGIFGPDRETRVRRLALLASFLLSLLLLEAALMVYFRLMGGTFRLRDAGAFTVPPRVIPRLRMSYDRDLGWTRPPRSDAQESLPVCGTSFGDSFVFGSEVGDLETWQVLFARRHGCRIVNLGVPGYGLDQSLLKLRSMIHHLRGSFVILGFIDGDHARNLSIYGPFLRGRQNLDELTKPRFELEGGGLRLVPNPVRSPDEVRLLAKPEFLRSIEFLDGWRSRFAVTYPDNRFPRLRVLFNFSFYLQWLGYEEEADDVTVPLSVAILSAFQDEVCRAGKTPVFIRFVENGNLDSHESAQNSREAAANLCLRAGIRCLLPSEKFEEAQRKGGLFEEYGHYSPYGHRLVVDSLDNILERVKSGTENSCGSASGSG